MRALFRGRALEQVAVENVDVVDEPRDRVALARRHARRRRSRAKLRIVREQREPVRDSVDVSRRNDEPGDAVRDDVAHAADIGRDDRLAGGLRLDHRTGVPSFADVSAIASLAA